MRLFISHRYDDGYERLWLGFNALYLSIELDPSYQKIQDQPAVQDRENNTDNKERGHLALLAIFYNAAILNIKKGNGKE
jgi:hypothetical protein